MKLGVSVYLAQPFSEQETYLQKVKANGFKVLFTSLHIPEDDASLYAERLQQIAMFAKHHDMELVCDVSPQSLEHLNMTWDEVSALKDWGVTGLRIDYGVSPETIAKIARKMDIILNASTLHDEEIAALSKAGVAPNHVEVWHNFYPRPETGLARDDFRRLNKRLQDYGYSVMAFIPGDVPRGPLYSRLPTLEDHREWSPFAAFLDLFIGEGVETVLVGDLELSDESIEQFRLFLEAACILLRAEVNHDITNLAEEHVNRNDQARDVLRSAESRSLATYGKRNVTPENTAARPLGTITVDNNRYGRYQGEVQITKSDLRADERVNVVGRVIRQDRPLLQQIKGGQKWKFKWM
ncbi:DUF871 domain-containing protein [Shouchella patagoniensis]|uniref:DUF871 domain-containing protein n=1 Tax=Shouchella patagoniensis TaxID=228576 RepID=UPI000994FB3B|nr:MupG family TIM beta-alpha barrel fold protein [Shouchella patagoniensis]